MEMNKKVEVFDSTLRDGAQGSGISFSLDDKLKITYELDQLGIDFIEAGNPGSNQKDRDYFNKLDQDSLSHSKLVAFGSTRRKNGNASDDEGLKNLVSANTPAISIFGKSWDYHVTDVLKTTHQENINMIYDTIAYLVDLGKTVFFDAEHFFDGYKANPEYAMETLIAAKRAGAYSLVLCDTNGGVFPDEVEEIVRKIGSEVDCNIGIHCHNDGGMAVANSILAVEAGANHVQGTFLGIGERCGNANLSSIIPNLQIKRGFDLIPEEKMVNLTTASRYIAEVSNISLDHSLPYVGNNAFAHKGGMHIDGILKAKGSFEHIEPELVGNHRKFIMSEVSGKNTIIKTIKKIEPTLTKDSPQTKEILEKLKELEWQGYHFESAEASFELVIRKHLGMYHPFFDLNYYKIIEEESRTDKDCTATAMIKVRVKDQVEITAAEGNGPVNAIDRAIRKALEVFYPKLSHFHLSDFKVRVLDGANTAAKVRVLIESTDGEDVWSTIGVSTNIIEASVDALLDSIEYKLIKDHQK
ncbi:MAG TPA: citramalate synthase [Eubacteriaceae bacterium]|nr:citramalate synthase [Eubacteriaceae bacterium]